MEFTPDDLDRLAATMTVDITTYGRRTGQPRRIEIWWFRIDGRFIVTGTPGKRDWLANVLANPRLIVHAAGFDIQATAHRVTDRAFRQTVFTQPNTSWYRSQEELDALIESAPVVEIRF